MNVYLSTKYVIFTKKFIIFKMLVKTSIYLSSSLKIIINLISATGNSQ